MIKWSHSRDNDVRTCERRAFLKYRYASATASKNSPRFRAFVLKRAVDQTAWAGNVAHHIIGTRIVPEARMHSGSFDVDSAVAAASVLINLQYEFSREHRFETLSKSQAGESYCILRPHVLEESPDTGLRDATLELCSRAIQNLRNCHSDLLSLIGRATRVESEKEIRIRVDAELSVEGILDLLLLSPTGRMAIVDWKLWGHGGFAGEQLLLYAYMVVNSGWWPDVTLDKISVVEANLLTGTRGVLHPAAEDMSVVDDRVFTGAERLERVFQPPDASTVNQRLFAPATRPGACTTCQVAEVCSDARYRYQRPTNLSFEFVSS